MKEELNVAAGLKDASGMRLTPGALGARNDNESMILEEPGRTILVALGREERQSPHFAAAEC